MAEEKDIWKELDLDRWTWELPRDTPGPYVAEHIPKPLITDWVKKWKPIINDALEKAEKLGVVQSSIDNVRDALYDALPTGDIDAFELIKVINAHIAKLDMILETLK